MTKTNLHKEIQEEKWQRLLLSEATYSQIFYYSFRRLVRRLIKIHRNRWVWELEVAVIIACVGYLVGRV